MTFPAEKLDFIPNPVNFTQDQILTAFRLVARTALAVRRIHRGSLSQIQGSFSTENHTLGFP